MPRKSSCHTREKRQPSRQHHHHHSRTVRIGANNGKRWLALRKRLGLPSDEELAVYLLDMADSNVK